MRILLVEDEKPLANAIKEGLIENNFVVDVAYDGESALSKIEIEEAYDLVILDIMLPKLDGINLLKKIRENKYKMPVLMLTAKGEIETKVKTFGIGADDYLTKPFDFRELLARVHALLRRTKEIKTGNIKIEDLEIDTEKMIVTRGGKKIDLTRKEYQILVYLCLNRGRIVEKKELENHLWDENSTPWSDTLRTHIKNIRRKVDSGFEKKLIKTIPGVGYEIE
ncbi:MULTISPECIES: response regulator transcription factor [Caldisericum]|jgi:DNA-binding response OmpR family regulator|uniref:DNA-binding response regulator n=1 Tax=Caldisericum exile TaxID=693075 RepID=A0A2J6WE70_9BACT|nr:MAG: DNA-binding response regulator [Caldisericum exile]